MNKEEFYEDIKRTYEKYGIINRKILTLEHPEYNVGWQLSKYSGLKNICKEIGIEYTQASRINKDDIKSDFCRVYYDNGEISQALYNKYGIYSSSAIKTYFGKFNNLMKECGFKQNVSRMDSKDEIINDFVNFYHKYNTTSSTMYRKYGSYCQSVIERLFGSWNEFIKSLNLKPINHKCGSDKMVNDIIELYNEYGFLSAKLINDNCDFTYQALSYYYTMDEISRLCGQENVFLKFQSVGAKSLYKILCELYGDENIIKEFSESWLINNITGKRMYVDFYIPQLKLAIEYDGSQHDTYVEFIHKNYRNFYYQVYRDRLKERLLLSHGIKTLRIKYEEKLSTDSIKQRILSI